jgi:hypothetical protein
VSAAPVPVGLSVRLAVRAAEMKWMHLVLMKMNDRIFALCLHQTIRGALLLAAVASGLLLALGSDRRGRSVYPGPSQPIVLAAPGMAKSVYPLGGDGGSRHSEGQCGRWQEDYRRLHADILAGGDECEME